MRIWCLLRPASPGFTGASAPSTSEISGSTTAPSISGGRPTSKQTPLLTVDDASGLTTWAQADATLQMEIKRQNLKLNRSCGKIPLGVGETQSLRGHARLRPPPLLDLHLSLRLSRRVNNDQTVDFEGRNYEISSTLRKLITIVHHPKRQFWVVENPPLDVWPSILAHYSL